MAYLIYCECGKLLGNQNYHPICDNCNPEVQKLRKKNAELVRDMNALDGCWEKKVERLVRFIRAAEQRVFVNGDFELAQQMRQEILEYECDFHD